MSSTGQASSGMKTSIAIVAVGDSLTEAPLRAASIFGALVAVTLAPVAWWTWQRRSRATA